MNGPVTSKLTCIVAGVLTVALVLPLPAHAQDPPVADTQFAALGETLEVGDSLTITDISGLKTKGRLAELSPAQITILVGGNRRTFDGARVERVQRTRRGVLLGAVIGGGAGIAAGLALASLFANEAGTSAEIAGAVLFPTAIGLGAGVAVDALLNVPRTVYRRDPRARVSVAPILGADTRGGAVRISF